MKYNIADIIVDINVRYPLLKNQGRQYLCNVDAPAVVTIDLGDEFIRDRQRDNPHLSPDVIEYLWTGAEYYNALLNFNGMMLHASCVVYDGLAYLFSAPCGTGKSTHTSLWLQRFPGSYILNDDKPALRIINGEVYAFGTPFSGKTDLSVNRGVPVGGICVLKRGETNSVKPIPTDDALFNILNQTVRPYYESDMDKLLAVLDVILRKIPIYELHCNTDITAAEVAYFGMNKIRKEQ